MSPFAILLLLSATASLSIARKHHYRNKMTIPSSYRNRTLHACTEVNVCGDAVFCIPTNDERICGGDASKPPQGTRCPERHSISFSACRKHLGSYSAIEKSCRAPESAQCVPLFNGRWGCVFPSYSAPGCVRPEEPQVETPPVPSIQKPDPKTLKIVTYNDVYVLEEVDESGHSEGGASRVARYIQSIKEQREDTLVLFAGDTMSPSLWSKMFLGMQMVTAHNHFLLDFASLGNHEFDLGLERFFDVAQASNFPWLNANCYEIETGELLRYTIPHAIKEVNGVRVGFFGIMYNMNDNSTGAYWTDPIEAAREQVALLKQQRAEFIIALTHQDWEDDDRFSDNVDGLDLIVGGHDHSAMMQTDYETPYVKADLDFKSVWVIDVKYYDYLAIPYSTFSYLKTPIVHNMPTDPLLDFLVALYKMEIDKEYGQPIGASVVELNGLQAVVRGQESALANFIADAIRYTYGKPSDVAVINGGCIRGNKVLSPGELTRADVVSWCPFGNYITTIKLTGKAFRAFLEAESKHSCTVGGALRQNGFLMHPSGFRYSYKCIGDKQGYLKSLTWGNTNEPIRDEEELLLNCNNYVYEVQQVLFESFNATIVRDHLTAIDEDLAIVNSIEYLQTISPQLDGRLQLIGTHNLGQK